MRDAALKAILDSEKMDALASMAASKLSKDRTAAMDYYLGDMSVDMPPIDGRSQAVSTDVADSIEGLMPSLMEIFAGSDEVVRFDPTGPEDVQQAAQETDYINYAFMQKNEGFLVLYHMIKDALLSKTGICKVWWEENVIQQKDTYYDQSDDVYNLLASDPSIEILEHTEHPANDDLGPSRSAPEAEQAPEQAPVYPGSGPGVGSGLGFAGMPQPAPEAAPPIGPMLHDITIGTDADKSFVRVDPLPPEEFGISRRARANLQAATYMFHEVVKPQNELVQQGYDLKQLKSLATYNFPRAGTAQEVYARDTVWESSGRQGDDGLNEAIRPIRVTEHYIVLDYEDTGVARKYRITTAGEEGEILTLTKDGKPDIVEIEFWPFAYMTPFIQTHRFYGRSIADVIMDIQRVKTSMTRAVLDNAYLANQPRIQVPEGAASASTFDDLLVSRPGGIVRTKTADPLNVISTPSIAGDIFPLIQYFDSVREWRTGVSRQGQGLDADALNNQTATAAMQVYNASQARMKLIARVFAETGIKDLFKLLHATIRQYGQKAQTVRLRNQWVTVDPRSWKERDDMTVHVGLGTGGKAEQLTGLIQVINAQKELLLNGMTQMVTPKNLYNSAAEMVRLIGKKDVDDFFTDPGDGPMPQPFAQQDPEMMKVKAQAQILQMKAQSDIQVQQQKTQSESQLAQQNLALERQKMLMAAQLEEHKTALELGMKERERASELVHAERMGTKKMRFDANSKRIGQGEDLDNEGNVTPSAPVMDALAEIKRLASAPRKTTIVRDAKTGKAAHSISTVEP